jgi:hypothetical protein
VSENAVPAGDDAICAVCLQGENSLHAVIDGVTYYMCDDCGSICCERAYLRTIEAGSGRVYDESYWREELSAARSRCYGSSVARVAETLLYCRRPVQRFVDLSCGAGYLLDSLAEMMPESTDLFWGIEPFPPPEKFRSTHPQYKIGFVDQLEGQFDAGICVEVIEHLTPRMLRGFAASLAMRAAPESLFFFNSGQPDYVLREDPGYLDPRHRGHIVSYSVDALQRIFGPEGFRVAALPGRAWACVMEFGGTQPMDADSMMTRVWTALPENRAIFDRGRFGGVLLTSGIEASRCYFESAR